MRIFVSVDMEGVSGVERVEEVFHGGHAYQTFRRIMAGDVNAAVQGAVDAGATDVVVSDSHGYMCNIRPADMHARARLRSGMQRDLCQFKGFDRRFDAVFLIGCHAKAGTVDGILSHTWVSAFRDVRVNGISVGEAGLNTYLAGHFGVPVILVTGDDRAIEQTRALIDDDAECVAVKQSLTRNSGIHLPIRESHALIRAGAKRAVERFARYRPGGVRLDGQVRLELDLADRPADSISRMYEENDRFSDFSADRRLTDVEVVAATEGVERVGPSTVAWTTQDFYGAYTQLYRALLHFYERNIEWSIEEVSDHASYDRDLSKLIGADPPIYVQ